MTGNLWLEAQFVKAEIGRLIDAYPDLAADEILRADMIDGETDAVKIIETALAERLDAVAIAEAIKARETDLAARRERFERKAEAMRSLISSIMKAAKQSRMQLAEATISVTRPSVSVGIADVDELPQGFFQDRPAGRQSGDAASPFLLTPAAFAVSANSTFHCSNPAALLPHEAA